MRSQVQPTRFDDVAVLAVDDITLTVTPASQANSLEQGGIRVDGEDLCTTVPTRLTALAGWLREQLILRQDLADSDSFDNATDRYTVAFEFDATNYFSARLRPDLGNNMELLCEAGGVLVTANAALPGGVTWAAGETKTVDVRYAFPNASLWVDGTYIVGLVMAAPLDGAPDRVFWGSGWGVGQLDSVVL
jgi:hypothetical protein